jgi:hypothetical protein
LVQAAEEPDAGSKRGLARAFRKFSAHSLAKYDRGTGVKLGDVLRLTHAKPRDAEQAALRKRVVARDLDAPDTWGVALSAGANKRERSRYAIDARCLRTVASIAASSSHALRRLAQSCFAEGIQPND